MTYDYIIVGAGSAGCVLANRLSADPGKRVLLLEAGGRDWHPFIHMPAGLAKLVGKKGVNWDYSTEPEIKLGNRLLWWPRGKVLGGSSSINAMCYIRGDARDYDEWAALCGDPSWSWQHVLPLFRRSEDNQRGADALHGSGGPLGVSDLRHHNVLSDVAIAAATSAGLPRNDDFNGPVQSGFGYYQVTQRDGARCSTAAAFLRPAHSRPNLSVCTGALATRLLLSGGRAHGVEYRRRGRLQRVEAGEVILSGGAINSPHLLLLSGIGPADHLRRHSINVAHDAPGVGGNLQDHLDICTLQRCTQSVTYDKTNDVAIALKFLFQRQGIGTSNIAETGGFMRSKYAVDDRCDLQFHFVPALLDDHGRKRMRGHGFTMHACVLRPKSRGRIELKSADPRQKPAIHANYLSDADGYDLKVLIEAQRQSRRILAQAAFAEYRGEEIFPGVQVQSDADVASFIRNKAESIYHPVGTCRMGRDPQSVVDPQLRVHGIAGLRVVDASVMPCLPGGNTNAPTVMIAERASELICAAA